VKGRLIERTNESLCAVKKRKNERMRRLLKFAGGMCKEERMGMRRE
jgi:hypothetical protein